MSPFCDKQDLFEARTDGYHVYRIPGLLVTPSGVVIAHCEARQGRGGDWDPIDIVMRRSTDGGVTWEEPFVAMDHQQFGDQAPINNFSCIADHVAGEVHVLFCSNYARVFSMKSDDDCLTFTDPVDVTKTFEAFRDDYPWRVIAVGPGHSIQLKSGRLLAAVWMSDGSSGEFGDKPGHRPSEVAVVYSDDHGDTWNAGEFVVRNTERYRHPNESTLVQLSDGRVLCNSRSESHRHRRLVSISSDGVSGWSEPKFDDALLDPICCGSIVGTSEGVVFSNPDVLERTMPGGPGERFGPDETGKVFDRKQLTVQISRDDCRSWEAKRTLEAGPSGYSDLAVLPDGTLLCLYECGIVNRMFDDRYLRLARFNIDWVLSS
ncbi:MAG: sialidase family protein [Pseudomonadota bacterium]